MKIYLDTSVISALFDERNPERKALTEEFFSTLSSYKVYVSELTLAEIEKTPDPSLREKMREIVSLFSVLEIDEKAEKYMEDAYHIAVAVVNEMDYLLSWNFRHIVRKTTKDIVRMVNTLKNLKHVEIITPGEMV